ncbi:MAG: Uma2 family endonuclease [Actinomycetota bacterium]
MPEQTALTYANLAAFPDDGLRRELLDGELIVSPSPRTRHQEIVGRLHLVFGNHVAAHGGGRVFIAPLDVLLSDTNVVEPDLFFVADRDDGIVGELNVAGVPTLVIEVLSQPRIDRVRKRDVYARFGVPEYWIVDPDSDWVEIYRLVGAAGAGRYAKPEIRQPDETLAYEGLPGLAIDLSALFAR